jgi:addiction module HigA family antidote
MSAGGQSKRLDRVEPGQLTPGDHLRAEIKRLGLDQVAVSKATGVSRQSVNNIINGRQPISRAMAGKLGRLTGRSSDYWLSAFFPRPGKSLRPGSAPLAVAGVLVNYQIIRAVTDGIIGIVPFDASNVHAASVALTIAKGMTLGPGATATARTHESIDLPVDYLGRIGIVGRLALAGLVATCAFQLAPGFKGRVDFCLFNARQKPLRLLTGDPVLALEIVRLGASPTAR